MIEPRRTNNSHERRLKSEYLIRNDLKINLDIKYDFHFPEFFIHIFTKKKSYTRIITKKSAVHSEKQ